MKTTSIVPLYGKVRRYQIIQRKKEVRRREIAAGVDSRVLINEIGSGVERGAQ